MKSFLLIMVVNIAFWGVQNLNAEKLTWDGSGSDPYFNTQENWDGDTVPVSGKDSVVFHKGEGKSKSWLRNEFIVGDGQSMTCVSNGTFRIAGNGHLTIASGGTLDFATVADYELAQEPNANNMRLTIEPNAKAKVYRYFTDADQTTQFIADTKGVTVLEVKSSIWIKGTLEVNLNDFIETDNDTLVLIDYKHDCNGKFDSIKLTEGWSGKINYSYDKGDGDLAVALTEIIAPK